MNITVHSSSDQETKSLGEQLGKLISSKISISLNGDLGAGKTTFVQGLGKGLGISDEYYITSPTYSIINQYPGKIEVYHMDMYRLGSSEELEYIGFDEIVESDSVIIIEWPDIIEKELISFDLEINFKTDENFNRNISLVGTGLEGINLIKAYVVK